MTVSDGKIMRQEFFASRAEGLSRSALLELDAQHPAAFARDLSAS
jgi:hypothetical protein